MNHIEQIPPPAPTPNLWDALTELEKTHMLVYDLIEVLEDRLREILPEGMPKTDRAEPDSTPYPLVNRILLFNYHQRQTADTLERILRLIGM
jgi:hypothetical protein